MPNFESPIPLSEIESVLAWVDTFKLSRPTKKINRDFSDAVLLAEILSIHYPKLVEMHNYPPRNSMSLKLNNWLTLNRKVLKKLKLNLCANTMEHLANCNPGIIERVLVMVRDKIRRDEEQNKTMKDEEQGMSSGGSFYEACTDDDNVLVVPVKTRVNGVMEMVHQKVVNYDSFQALKEELKDAKESVDMLKQKVEHLDSLLKLKDQRIDELQKQLDRKQARKKEAEAFQNSLQVPFETVPSPVVPNINDPAINFLTKIPSFKSVEPNKEESNGPVKADSNPKLVPSSKLNPAEILKENSVLDPTTPAESPNPVTDIYNSNKAPSKITEIVHALQQPKEESKIPIKCDSAIKTSNMDISSKGSTIITLSQGKTHSSHTKINVKLFEDTNNLKNSSKITDNNNQNITKPMNTTNIDLNPEVSEQVLEDIDVDRIKSDVFKEAEIVELHDIDEFKDSVQESDITTIEETIQNEIKNIINPEFAHDKKIHC